MHLSHANVCKPLRCTLLPSEGNCSVFDTEEQGEVYGWDTGTGSSWATQLTHDIEPGVDVSNTTGNVVLWSRLLLRYAVNQTFLNKALYDRGYLRVVCVYDHNPESGTAPTVDELFAVCTGGTVLSANKVDCFQNPLFAERFHFLLDDLIYVPSAWTNGSGLYSVEHSTRTVGQIYGTVVPQALSPTHFDVALQDDVFTYGEDAPAVGQTAQPNRSAMTCVESFTRDSTLTREYEINLDGLRTVMDKAGSYPQSGSIWAFAWYQYTKFLPDDPTTEDDPPFFLNFRARLIGESTMRPAGFKKPRFH